MAGHYAPHQGNMWASARLRAAHRAPPRPARATPLEPGSPKQRPAAPPLLASEPARAAHALQRWLQTHGAPDAVALLRAIGARARHALDDAEEVAAAARAAVNGSAGASAAIVEPPVRVEWSAWRLALRLAFWMVFAALGVLRWARALRARAARRLRNAQRRVAMLQQLDAARDYDAWVEAAAELDHVEGRAKWKSVHVPTRSSNCLECDRDDKHCSGSAPEHADALRAVGAVCDLDMLIAKLSELSRLYASGDVRGLAFALRATLQRNYAGVCHPELSNQSRVGTSRIVEDYVHVVSYLLAYIAQSDNAPGPPKRPSASQISSPERVCGAGENSRLLSIENKLLMFNEARIAYGRTALMLSGGATMGINHLGVVKALLDQNLMPKVVCGTSAGALVASIVGIFEDDELLKIIESDDLMNPLTKLPFSFRYFDEHTSTWGRIRRMLRTGVIQDVRMLQDCLRRNFGDITFQEAYMRTRRILNITVCAVRTSSDPPMLLNYLTAPHVLVWSAASASCALPLVFAPVELVAKGYDGRLVPYHPHGVRWIDGSITSDIPLARIGELFNVNHFIVSQTNPHIIPRGMPFLKTRLAMLLKSELQFRYWQALQLNLVPRFLSAIFPHFMQPYEGDVTIMPEISPSDLRRLLCNPTLETVKDSIRRGEKHTFPFLDRIRRQCIIEKALDASVEHVARIQRGEHNADAAAATAASSGDDGHAAENSRGYKRGNSLFGRVPSWLWLDATSILSAAPAAVASRITARTVGNGVAVAPESPPILAGKDSEHIAETMALERDASGSAGLAACGGSPKWSNGALGGAALREGGIMGIGRTELEKMWVEFGVQACTERSVVEPVTDCGEDGEEECGDEEGDRSDVSEEERIIC